MRIGIEAQRLFRPKKYGIDYVTIEFIKQLALIDTQNEYYLYIKSDKDFDCLPYLGDNFKLFVFPAKNYMDWEQFRLPKIANSHALDLIHFTANTAPLFINVPYVITMHDTIFFEQIEFFKKGVSYYQQFGNFYRKVFAKRAVKKAKKIITVSNTEKDNISTLMNVEKSKIQTVYNGVSDDFKVKLDNNQKQHIRQKFTNGDSYIFLIGSNHPRKNIKGALAAANILINKYNYQGKFVLPNTSNEELDSLLINNNLINLKNSIITTQYLSREDLIMLIASADLMLFPSFREGFGLPIVEAFACGVPVVTSNVSSLPEIASDAGLVADPYSPEDIAQKAFSIINNPEFAKTLIERAYTKLDLYRWDNYARSIIEIYKEEIKK